jgi:putative transposase
LSETFRFTSEQAGLETGAPMNVNRPPLTKRQYLRALVYEKSKWDEPLSDEDKARGFLGWHERGYLPHCDKPGLVQLVTLRLRRGEWERLLKIEDMRERRMELESYLDRGVGECWLRDSRVAGVVEEAMRFHHGERYELLAWCVMPNHVHVLVHVWDWPLWKLIASWKRFSATRALRLLEAEGRFGDRRSRAERRFPNRHEEEEGSTPNRSSALRAFWQREYWDTFMRDAEQEKTAVRYVENNPVKAKLCRTTEDWPFSSARFRDEYRRLVLPGKP